MPCLRPRPDAAAGLASLASRMTWASATRLSGTMICQGRLGNCGPGDQNSIPLTPSRFSTPRQSISVSSSGSGASDLGSPYWWPPRTKGPKIHAVPRSIR